MCKIFRYELGRLLWNRVFLGILAVLLAYGWQTLTGETLLGTANTAPFSPWSFGSYCAGILPVICAGELFFLTFFTSARECRALAEASPVDPGGYAAVRLGAVLAGTLLLSACGVFMALGFYGAVFGWTGFAPLLLPGLLVLVPAAVFCLGLGWALGRIHGALLYAAIAGILLASQLPMPAALELTLGTFFETYPRSLGTLDPAFTVPGTILWSRAGYAAAGGIALLCLRKRREK